MSGVGFDRGRGVGGEHVVGAPALISRGCLRQSAGSEVIYGCCQMFVDRDWDWL